MKRILFALAMFAAVLPALPQVRADVSVDFFYNNLSGGNWIEVEGYGYGWQPDVAVSDPNWRPYADGYWAYTEVGWTWVSYEDFGWATYHYGRWASLADYGWVWFPGSDLEWGPAWVSWRTGGDYVGWAPLPPRGPGIAYAGGPIGGRVDIEFDIGPAYYNFIDVRFIGEPVLRDRIFPYSQNVTYISNTVNVTNITVQNNIVYNYGPDYNTLSSYSSRPIQRLTIDRQPSADLSAAAKTGALTKVQGDKLMVGAPQKFSKGAAGAPPPKVKAKVAQPKIQKGWTGVSNEAQVKEKMKTENPKNVPPPTRAATGRPAGAASPVVGASPAAPGAPATPPSQTGRPGQAQPGLTGTPAVSPAGSPAPIERGRGRAGGRRQPGATHTPAAAESPVASPGAPGMPSERGRGRGRGRPGASPEGVASPSEAASPGASPIAPERGKGKGRPSPGGPPQRIAPPERTAAPETTQPTGEPRGRPERGVASPTPGQPGGAGASEAGRQRRGGSEQAGTPSTPPAGPLGSRGRRERGQGAQPGEPPAGETPAAAERGRGKPEGGKKKGQVSSPTPGPQ